MGEYTKGPWLVDAFGDVQANGEDVALVVGHYGVDETAANARLIAAAPDLLEALLLVNANTSRADWPNDIHDAIQSAIAKATQP